MNLRRKYDPYVAERLDRLKDESVKRLSKRDVEQLEKLIPLTLENYMGKDRYDNLTFRLSILELVKKEIIHFRVMNLETRRRRLLSGKS